MNSARQDARELLAFYLDAGVDAPVGEVAVDRFADHAPTSPPAGSGRSESQAFPAAVRGEAPSNNDPTADRVARSGPPASGKERIFTPAAPAAPEAAIMAAREAARSAKNLEELRALLEAFEGCMLRATATRLVFADGNPQARVMFVGEAPGREEDLEGLPFVGRSGQLLDRMLAPIGVDRTTAYIANVIPWRPPGNRTPTPQETEVCLPFTLRQIELANPDILVCLGGPSAQTLLGLKEGIRRSRGRWHAYNTGSREIRAIATFHPAYLLRNPIEKRFVWRDLLAIRKALAELPSR
jgi:uracil-DNA glycosylase family 4